MARKPNEIRPVKIKRGYTSKTPGSVLYKSGKTTVLCTASIEEDLPPWMKASGKGWLSFTKSTNYVDAPKASQMPSPKKQAMAFEVLLPS